MESTSLTTSLFQTPAPRVNNQSDDLDDDRALWGWERFNAQDGSYRLRDREIEQNIRFLAGQQWWQYHHLLGWKDITYWMSDEEKRWKERPVFNRIQPWFVLTHARMTENQFICTFLPGPDKKDSDLAEINDILYKKKWRDVGMTDVWDRAAGWMIASGAAYLQSRIDVNKGEWRKWVGQGDVPVHGPDGMPLIDQTTGQPVTQSIPEGVPFDRQGNPLAQLHPDGLKIIGKPHAERTGDLVVDVLSPLEVRGQWGPIPWHEQKIHIMRSFLTPEDVWNTWKVECEPDVRGEAASSAGFLERMLFGSGFFGAASAMIGSEFSTTGNAKDGYCCVQTTYQAPLLDPKDERLASMIETPDAPGGRMMVSTRTKILRDGPRPFAYQHTSPIREYQFLRLPGRSQGSTPLEILVSPQKAYNKGWKQILANRDLSSNPQQVYDTDSGLKKDQIDNQPGRQYGVRMKQGVDPIKWIVPPSMSSDVWHAQEGLAHELDYLGSTQNTAGQVSNPDASGELIKELRFNDDRFLGPTMRRAAEESGRLVTDWMTMLPLVYDEPTILNYTGEDNVARTMQLMPDIFKSGTAQVIPDVESMLPEGRGERRARVYKMWQDGAFGPPVSPEAIRQLHDLSQFPHMSRTAKPGGIHWITASQENGELLQGQMPPTYEWYDDQVHLTCINDFMSAPEFRRLTPDIQKAFMIHRIKHLMNVQRKQAQALGHGEPKVSVTVKGSPLDPQQTAEVLHENGMDVSPPSPIEQAAHLMKAKNSALHPDPGQDPRGGPPKAPKGVPGGGVPTAGGVT